MFVIRMKAEPALLLLFCSFYEYNSETHIYECHDWTYEDKLNFWLDCTVDHQIRDEICEENYGFTVTRGMVCTCHCCQPTRK